jgi:hypothetical protein
MDDDKQVTASFAAQPVTLEVDVVGQGSVEIEPDQGTEYKYGDLVTLTAVPAEEWVFDHWEGDVQGADKKNPAVYELNGDTELTAVFKERPPWTYLPVVIH